jgi:hypothetical protein
MQIVRITLVVTVCLACQEDPVALGPSGDGPADAAADGGTPDVGGGPVDVGRPDLGSEDVGTPDRGPPVVLPAVAENVSLQVRLVDYARTGDVSPLPDDVRNDPPFVNHSIRVDVRTELAGSDDLNVLIHPPFGESSGPYRVREDDATDEIAFTAETCAICVSATARTADSRFVVSRLVLGTVVDEDGVRRWSGTGRIEGIETDEGSLVSVEAESPLTVRLDDVAPRLRVETTPSVLLPFEGLRLRFSEPVLDQATLIEVDTSQGRAEFDLQPRAYGFDGGGSQLLGYDLAPAEPWPPGEITVRYFDPHVDASGNVARTEDFVVSVHRDPRASERIGFENSLQDHSAWGPNVDRRFVDDRCIGNSCLEFVIGESSDAGVLTRLDFGGPIESVGFRVRLLSEACDAGLDIFSVALRWGEAAAFAGRVGRSVRATTPTREGGCDSGWVQLEAPLPAPVPDAWLSVELRKTLDRSPPLILLVDEIIPRPALTNN